MERPTNMQQDRGTRREGRMTAVFQEAYGSAGVLELRDIERPEIDDGEVLVRVRAAGVDPGVWHVTAGLPYMVRLMGFGLHAPKQHVPGSDAAGVVEAVGAAVTRFRSGDEVFGAFSGAFAEYAAAPEEALAPKPANLSFEQAAAVPVSAISALQGLRDVGRVQPGQHVLIIGASGGVGSFAVQLAKEFGAQVTGVCSTAKIDLVRSLGADHVIDYTRQDPVDGSHRYDLILDAGGIRPLSALRRALTPRGSLVLVGGEGGGRWLGGFDRQIVRAPLLSLFVGQQLRPLIAKHRGQDLRYLAELLAAGKVTPALDRTFPLAEAAEAIRYVHEGHARGKVVLTV